MSNFFNNRIINNGISDFDDEIKAEYFKYLNIYIFLFVVQNFILGIFDWYYGFYGFTVYLLCLSFFMFYVLSKKFKFLKNVKTTFYVVFSFTIFYVSSCRGFHSGITLYYIPLLLSIPFIYNISESKIDILIIVAVIVIELAVNFYTDHLLFYDSDFTLEIQEDFFITSLVSSVIWILITIYFINRKQDLLLVYYNIQKDSQKKIEKLNESSISYNDLNDLILLAESNASAFFVKFKEKAPCFIDKLKSDYPQLVQTEIEICVYIRLNFKTKDIARFTNSSVRSIESKKYRIRRKMNLTSEDINIFIISRNLRDL